MKCETCKYLKETKCSKLEIDFQNGYAMQNKADNCKYYEK